MIGSDYHDMTINNLQNIISIQKKEILYLDNQLKQEEISKLNLLNELTNLQIEIQNLKDEISQHKMKNEELNYILLCLKHEQ